MGEANSSRPSACSAGSVNWLRRDARTPVSQGELANKSGMGIDMISKIESGASGARFPTIIKLARALGADPGELFTPATTENSSKTNRTMIDIVVLLGNLSQRDLEWAKAVFETAMSRPK